MHASGSVEYVGEFGVDIPGRHTARVDPGVVANLLKSADAIEFFSMQDHWTPAAVPLVHDVEQHVGRVGAVGEIARFIDDEAGRMRVRRQGAGTKWSRGVIDELGGGGEGKASKPFWIGR